jgi:hypothetical protein
MINMDSSAAAITVINSAVRFFWRSEPPSVALYIRTSLKKTGDFPVRKKAGPRSRISAERGENMNKKGGTT